MIYITWNDVSQLLIHYIHNIYIPSQGVEQDSAHYLHRSFGLPQMPQLYHISKANRICDRKKIERYAIHSLSRPGPPWANMTTGRSQDFNSVL